MSRPLIVVNYKTYDEATGKNAIKLTEKLSKISKNMIVCPQVADISNCSKNKIKVFAQHVDYFDDKKSTGFVTLNELISAGAKGSLLNHSEHRLKIDQIKKTIKFCEDKKFKLIVCVENSNEAKKILKFGKVFAMALEIPELISSGKSITEYKADEVIKFTKIIKESKKKNNPVLALCGAGITSKKDIDSAKKLGCEGVLIASAVVKAKDPVKILR